MHWRTRLLRYSSKTGAHTCSTLPAHADVFLRQNKCTSHTELHIHEKCALTKDERAVAQHTTRAMHSVQQALAAIPLQYSPQGADRNASSQISLRVCGSRLRVAYTETHGHKAKMKFLKRDKATGSNALSRLQNRGVRPCKTTAEHSTTTQPASMTRTSRQETRAPCCLFRGKIMDA